LLLNATLTLVSPSSSGSGCCPFIRSSIYFLKSLHSCIRSEQLDFSAPYHSHFTGSLFSKPAEDQTLTCYSLAQTEKCSLHLYLKPTKVNKVKKCLKFACLIFCPYIALFRLTLTCDKSTMFMTIKLRAIIHEYFVQDYLHLAWWDTYGTKYVTIGWTRSAMLGKTKSIKYNRDWINV
jgi:hypothetical protein